MAKEFSLSVVAPDRSVVEERVTSVIAPGSAGYFGVMGGHEPMIASLNSGVLEYTDTSDQKKHVAMGGGFAEVTGERMTVLADSAEKAEDIDVAEAEQRLEEARRSLRGESSSMTQQEATLEMDRAMTRIRAARLKA